MTNCKRTFRKCAGLKAHLYRDHKKRDSAPSLSMPVDLTCHVDFCSDKSDSLTDFYAHLKVHIKKGRAVACSFMLCGKTFTVVSTFTSHLSRKKTKCRGKSNVVHH